MFLCFAALDEGEGEKTNMCDRTGGHEKLILCSENVGALFLRGKAREAELEATESLCCAQKIQCVYIYIHTYIVCVVIYYFDVIFVCYSYYVCLFI